MPAATGPARTTWDYQQGNGPFPTAWQYCSPGPSALSTEEPGEVRRARRDSPGSHRAEGTVKEALARAGAG